nr:uncharacterized protein LOC115260241 [Aedes albopictus]
MRNFSLPNIYVRSEERSKQTPNTVQTGDCEIFSLPDVCDKFVKRKPCDTGCTRDLQEQAEASERIIDTMSTMSTDRLSADYSTQTGSCVHISRPAMTRYEGNCSNRFVVTVASENKISARMALLLKQHEEERALQRREWEAERRAFEQEKRLLQKKYSLLMEQSSKRRDKNKRTQVATTLVEMDIPQASPKQARSGDGGICSRPESYYHLHGETKLTDHNHTTMRSISPCSRTADLDLRPQQNKEERAIEQRQMEVKRRAPEFEREIVRARYILLQKTARLREMTNEAFIQNKHNNDNKPSADGVMHLAPGRAAGLLKNAPTSGIRSGKPLCLLPLVTVLAEQCQIETGIQQRNISAFPSANGQSTIITDDKRAENENILTLSLVDKSSVTVGKKLDASINLYRVQTNKHQYRCHFINQRLSIILSTRKLHNNKSECNSLGCVKYEKGNGIFCCGQQRILICVRLLLQRFHTQRATSRATVATQHMRHKETRNHTKAVRTWLKLFSIQLDPDTGQERTSNAEPFLRVRMPNPKCLKKYLDCNTFPQFINGYQNRDQNLVIQLDKQFEDVMFEDDYWDEGNEGNQKPINPLVFSSDDEDQTLADVSRAYSDQQELTYDCGMFRFASLLNPIMARRSSPIRNFLNYIIQSFLNECMFSTLGNLDAEMIFNNISESLCSCKSEYTNSGVRELPASMEIVAAYRCRGKYKSTSSSSRYPMCRSLGRSCSRRRRSCEPSCSRLHLEVYRRHRQTRTYLERRAQERNFSNQHPNREDVKSEHTAVWMDWLYNRSQQIELGDACDKNSTIDCKHILCLNFSDIDDYVLDHDRCYRTKKKIRLRQTVEPTGSPYWLVGFVAGGEIDSETNG